MSGELAPEEHFGPYLVYERLGVGGMATVHRALEQSDDGEGRIIALKRLLPHLAEDATFIKAFVREAKLASLLNHLNIVQIYELGRVGTEYFISMEYIDGRDIRRLLRHARKVTGPPPIYVTVGLMLQLCDALDYAHHRVDENGNPLGLVHRDISPSNLIVTSTGQLKIIDFGIAKAQSSQLRTQTGRVKGKLAYMAPEAVSGSRDLDARSDIWAAGVILHEMITARPLFASKNEYQTLLKVQKGDILPPSTFNQACPPELDAIVFRSLARDPDDRFESASDLREELLALKKQYALQTGFRELAGWIEWAFGQEPPGGFSGDTNVGSGNTSRVHAKTPRPPRDQEEDEAVEVVWGSGNNESEEGPVVLEEVPDVSGKVRAKRDTEDENLEEDDIPTPLPSHGTMPSVYGKPANPLHALQPDPKLFGAEAALARGTDKPAARPLGPQVPMPARSKIPTGLQPAMPRTVTGPQPFRTSHPSGAQPIVARTSTSSSPPPPSDPRQKRPTAPGVAAPVRGSDRMAASAPVHLDAPQLGDRMAAQRERDVITAELAHLDAPLDGPTVLQRAESLGDHATVLRAQTESVRTDPLAKPLSPEELFGDDAARVLGGISEQMEAMATSSSMGAFREEPTTSPEMKHAPATNVPVVRFSKGNSIPPMNVPMGGLDQVRPASTKPGIGPAQGVTPALPRSAPSTSRPPANKPVDIIAPQSSSKKVLLFIGVGVLLAGGTAALVAMSMSGGAPAADSESATTEAAAPTLSAPVVPPAPATGKVKFDLVPADAEITVAGVAVHTGSPWTTELAPGTHPIEIHKTGYKSWLTSLELSALETATLRVVLEPITTVSDATLTVATTPDGLDVYIDGARLGQTTPIKTALKVGSHKIVVKQNGVDVWQQNVNAEASSDYEFHPSFTDDKKRERAQHTQAPRPVPAEKPPVPTKHEGSAGSGSSAGSAGSADAPPAADTTPAPSIAPSLEKPRRTPAATPDLNKGAPPPPPDDTSTGLPAAPAQLD
jgi:serine/threonine protein kinase